MLFQKTHTFVTIEYLSNLTALQKAERLALCSWVPAHTDAEFARAIVRPQPISQFEIENSTRAI